MANNKDILELYHEAYIEGFKKSRNVSYENRKDEAKKYAADICPEGAFAIKEFGKCVHERRSPNGDIEWLGQKIAKSLSMLNLKELHVKQFGPKSVPVRRRIIEDEGSKYSSTIEMYQAACDKFDHIPSDVILQHFTGYTKQNWHSVRGIMNERGYILESNGGDGWKVSKRPTPPPIEVKKPQYDAKMIADIVAETLRKLNAA